MREPVSIQSFPTGMWRDQSVLKLRATWKEKQPEHAGTPGASKACQQMETIVVFMFQLDAQLGCICGKTYFLQVFMAGKHLGGFAAFTFNFTNLFKNKLYLFCFLISNYKHYRIPVPAPFVSIDIFISCLCYILFILNNSTSSNNRITRLQECQNLFYPVIILNSMYQLKWILVHRKSTSLNLTKIQNHKDLLVFVLGFFFFFFWWFPLCKTLYSLTSHEYF